jgi:hypothetical protein
MELGALSHIDEELSLPSMGCMDGQLDSNGEAFVFAARREAKRQQRERRGVRLRDGGRSFPCSQTTSTKPEAVMIHDQPNIINCRPPTVGNLLCRDFLLSLFHSPTILRTLALLACPRNARPRLRRHIIHSDLQLTPETIGVRHRSLGGCRLRSFAERRSTLHGKRDRGHCAFWCLEEYDDSQGILGRLCRRRVYTGSFQPRESAGPEERTSRHARQRLVVVALGEADD